MSQETKKPERHIVIIDDDITALDIVSFLFEERGFTVHRFSDGQSAIEFTKKFEPDLVIVDLLMPNLNGVETVKEIRGQGHTTVPIIAFTAVDDDELHSQALSAGSNEVITKPCPSDRLIKTIERYLPKIV